MENTYENNRGFLRAADHELYSDEYQLHYEPLPPKPQHGPRREFARILTDLGTDVSALVTLGVYEAACTAYASALRTRADAHSAVDGAIGLVLSSLPPSLPPR